MSIRPDHDVLIHHVIAPGLSGDGLDAAEAAAVRADVASLLARPAITKLADVPDVTDTPVDGEPLVWNATTQTWDAGAVGGSIQQVRNRTADDTAIAFPDINDLYFWRGFEVQNPVAGRAIVTLIYGASGGSFAVSREDHTHTLRTDQLFTYPESGALSSGTRQLVTGQVTGLDPARTYVLKGTLSGDVQGGGTGAGYSTPRVTIHGNTRARFGRVRSVAGVPREFTCHHGGVSVTGVSTVTVSADIQYSEGDPIIVSSGVLKISVEANR